MSMFAISSLCRTAQSNILALRAALHAAKPLNENPRDYIDVGLPLTALEYVPTAGAGPEAPSRLQSLRHALFELDEAEKALAVENVTLGDLVAAMSRSQFVAGVLFAHGSLPKGEKDESKAA